MLLLIIILLKISAPPSFAKVKVLLR